MVASKDNKVYTILESQKQNYIDLGFDIYGDKGEIIGYGRGKTVPYEKYVLLEKEIVKLRAEIDKLKVGKNKKAGE